MIPVVIPTVPIAENVSNRISENPSGCIAMIASDAVTASKRLIVRIVPARLTASFSSLRPKILIPYVCLILECTHKRRTTRVVVLMPPAVEPGLPPMNIRMMVSSLLPSVKAAVSVVLKPAVLAVTELNKEVRILPLVFIPTTR